MRTTRAAAAIALLLAGVLASCGSGEEPASGGSSAVSGTFPVTIEHKFGRTVVPDAPKRVVALGKNDAEALISLGLPPVATSSGLDVYPWLRTELKKANSTALADEAGPPLERIASLRPDLIVAMDVADADEYKALTKIAPTLTYAKERFGYSWQEFTRYVGRATGRDARAKSVIADTERRMAAITRDVPGIAGKTFSLSSLSRDYPFVRYKDNDPAVAFFTELGMRPSPETKRMARGEIPLKDDYLSLERIDLLDADLVVTAFQTPADKRFFAGNRVFNRMSAVKRGSVVELDQATIGQVLLPSALGNLAVLPKVAEQLDAASSR